MISELKPCPFCGGKAKIFDDNEFDDWLEYGIICDECSVSLTHTSFGCSFETEEAVAEAWNTRYERTCRIEELDEDCYPVPSSVYGDGFCSHCWGIVDDEDKHCKHCGAKVVG